MIYPLSFKADGGSPIMPVLSMRSAGLPALRCPDGQQKIDYCDQLCKGLVLEVRCTGGRTWYVRFTNGRGQRRQLRIGDATLLTLAEARAIAQEHRHSAALGADPAKERQALRDVPTLESFVQKSYLPFIQVNKKSWKYDQCLLGRHILPAIGDKQLDLITRSDVQTLMHRRIADGSAPGSVNKLLILLRYLFNQAMRWETPGVSRNPTVGIPLLKLNNQRQRFLSADEASKLMQAVNQCKTPMLAPIVAFLLLTGARKREVLDARWDCIDWQQRIWRIPVSKSGKARYVPIGDDALLLLRQRQLQNVDGCPWVFASPTTGQAYACITHTWNRARERAGMPDLRLHDLRHSFASFLVNNGRSLYEVQRILGHSTARMTERYAHLAQDTLLQATNAVSGALKDSMSSLHQDLEQERQVQP